MLLRALHAALKAIGVDIVSGVDVATVEYDPGAGTFEAVGRAGQRWKCNRLVLAACLGNAALAPQIGVHAPVTPTRGQVLITERLQPFINYPTKQARQTNKGTVK